MLKGVKSTAVGRLGCTRKLARGSRSGGSRERGTTSCCKPTVRVTGECSPVLCRCSCTACTHCEFGVHLLSRQGEHHNGSAASTLLYAIETCRHIAECSVQDGRYPSRNSDAYNAQGGLWLRRRGLKLRPRRLGALTAVDCTGRRPTGWSDRYHRAL